SPNRWLFQTHPRFDERQTSLFGWCHIGIRASTKLRRTFMTSMIRFLTLAALLVGSLSITALAQTSTVIPDSEAAQHTGQNATVEGVVVAVSASKKGNAFINFGGVYPNQTFTGWIPAGTPLASDPSIQSLQGKRVKITGLIELYRGKPEIRILSKSQITQ